MQIFDRISDRAWVVSECLRFEAHTLHEARMVLQCALKHAVAYAVQDQLTSDDRAAALHLTDEELALCGLRFRVLHALDVLDLHELVARAENVPAQPRAAIALRDRALADEAVTAARVGRTEVASILVAGDGGAEDSAVWNVIDALADTLPASEYEPLLRCALQPSRGRELDWLEDARVLNRVSSHLPPHIAAHFAHRLACVAAPLAVVEARLGARIRAIDRRIGWAEGAAALAALALSLWSQAAALQSLDHALRQLCMLVYETSATNMTLEILEAEKDEASRIALLLDALPDESPASLRSRLQLFAPNNTAQAFAASIARCVAPQPGCYARVLSLLLHECTTPAALRLITPTSLLVRSALSSAYASPDQPATHVAALERLALSLAAIQREENGEEEDREAVATLGGQVAALKLLLPYGVTWRLPDLAAAPHDPEKGAWLLEWLARQGVSRRAARGATETERDRLWRELLADLRFLQHAPLGPAFATPESVSAAALTGLLSAQRFALATELIARPDLPPARVRSLCLAAARAHVDGAASLADSEALGAAAACLDLAQATPESSTDIDYIRERSLLSALRRLAADEGWRRALVLWPPSRIRTSDAAQLGSILLSSPLAFKRTTPLMDVLSLLGLPRARLLPLLLTAATAALDAGEHDTCATLLTQLHEANHAPAVALTRRWLFTLSPDTTPNSRPYATAKQALGFLAAHDSLLSSPEQPSVPHLYLLAHTAPPASPQRSLGALAAAPPPLVAAPPPTLPPTLRTPRFYRPVANTANAWSPSPLSVRYSALASPAAPPPPSQPDAVLLLASILHQPSSDVLAHVTSLLNSAETLPASSSLLLLRILLTVASVHYAGVGFLRASVEQQLDTLKASAPDLAARVTALVTQARSEYAPDPRALLSSPAPLAALQRLDTEKRTELLQSALTHALDTRPSDVQALLSLSAQASVEPSGLVRTASLQALPSPAATEALRNARVALTWPSLAPPLDGTESAEVLLSRTAAQLQTESQAETWLQLLAGSEPLSISVWASLLSVLFAPVAAPASPPPTAFLRRVLHRVSQATSPQDEATLLATLRSKDTSSLLLIEAELGSRTAETQEAALNDLLKHAPPLELTWPGIALLPSALLSRLRTSNAALYSHLLRAAANAAPLAIPRLCHPAELALCALINNAWLSDAASVQLLLMPRSTAVLDKQLLRVWRRVSLLSCEHCQQQRQAAIGLLTRLIG